MLRLNAGQKKVFAMGTPALLFAVVVLWFVPGHYPWPLPDLDSVADRIAFTLKWSVLPASMLAAGVLAVSNARFFSEAIDPLAGREGRLTQVCIRYLQNTLEQFVLMLVASLALAANLEPAQMTWIPALALLWTVGRIAFWVGYAIDPLARTFGFALTFVPTLGVLGYGVYRLIAP